MSSGKILAESINLSFKEKLEIASETKAGLKLVEQVIVSKFDSKSLKLNEIASYLFSVGGKRIRPILTLLVSQSLGLPHPSAEIIDVAAGIELIHMATLLHDDIIDKSPLRRHETSPWVKFGTDDTLLCGDFILTRAFALCARLDQYIINKTEIACVELTEGEIEEKPLSKKAFTLADSLEVSRKKTASLFRLSCESASYLANQKSDVIELFANVGENLGIAFQVLDDILDVISTEDLLGKKSGIDLIEQKPSIVNVLWLASGSNLAKQILLSSEPVNQELIQKGLKEIKDSAVINSAKEIARQYCKDALQSLDGINSIIELETNAKQALIGLATYIQNRMS